MARKTANQSQYELVLYDARAPWPPVERFPYNFGDEQVKRVVRADLLGSKDVLLITGYTSLFGFCVWVLQAIGDFTGMGYELANVVIFVVLHPALPIALFVLWRRARRQALECSSTQP